MMNAFGIEEHGNMLNWPETGYDIDEARSSLDYLVVMY